MAAAPPSARRHRCALGETPRVEATHLPMAAIHTAAMTNQPAGIRAALLGGADVDAPDSFQETALHYAARYGRLDAVAVLLEAGANVHELNADERTPLHAAAEGGTAEIARLLLDHGANPDACDRRGGTPEKLARRRGNAPVAEVLSAWSSCHKPSANRRKRSDGRRRGA